jgi:hypothetical protein
MLPMPRLLRCIGQAVLTRWPRAVASMVPAGEAIYVVSKAGALAKVK